MNGALLLGMISLITITDILLALVFFANDKRQESEIGTPPASDSGDLQRRRQTARFLLIFGPLLWLVIAVLSFGIIPVDGITPIKF